MSKFTLAAVAGLGFLAGSRAGRGPYDQTMSALSKFRSDPRVQKAATQAQDAVQEKATEVAAHATEAAKHKAADAIDAVKSSRAEDG